MKLREYGVELPSIESLDETIETSGLAAALDLYRALELPDGWEVEELASLSTFMFAKEAMLRDLETNEERILENPILNVIADPQSDLVGQFAFDLLDDEQIDAVAPPELAHLVMDADSSQRAAVAAARDGKSFVLDGPPGTGKSQTIANIIAALIHDGKRVLFVSEKVVALDVVRDRLTDRGLGSFLLPLHSHKAVRSEVAAMIAAALILKPVPGGRAKPITRVRSEILRESLNQYADAMNEIRSPLEVTVHEALGALEMIAASGESPTPSFSAGELDPSLLGEIKKEAATAARYWDVLRRGNEDLWWGLTETDSLRYDLQSARAALENLNQALNTQFPNRRAFGFQRTSDWRRALELSAVWHQQYGRIDTDWLTKPDLQDISRSIDAFAISAEALLGANTAAETLLGSKWRNIPVPNIDRSVNVHLGEVIPALSAIRMSELVEAGVAAAAGADILSAIMDTTAALATHVGLHAPTHVAGLNSFLKAVDAVLAINRPKADWVRSRDALVEITSGARSLHTAIEQESLAGESARAFFTNDIQGLDAKLVSERIRANSTFARRFSREARTDRQTIAGLATGPVKKSLAQLALACEWQESRQALSSLEAQFSPLLGNYAATDEGWPDTEQALEAGNTLLSSAEVADAVALNRALDDDAVRALSTALTTRLNDQLVQWRTFTAHPSISLSLERSEGSTDAARELLRESAKETTRIELELRAIVVGLGIDPILNQAWEAAQARVEADTQGRASHTVRVGLSAVLGQEIYETTKESVQALQEKFKWTQDVRLAGTASSEVAMSDAQVAALVETTPSVGPPAFGKEWETRLSKLQQHFSPQRSHLLADDLDDLLNGIALLERFVQDVDGPDRWLSAHAAQNGLTDLGLGNVVQALLEADVSATSVSDRITQATLRHWINHHLKNDARLRGKFGESRDELVAEYRRIDRELIADASNEIILEASARRPTSAYGQSALIRREGEKKRRHIPVRDLIDQARDVIQAIHPCFMMSPLAVSQYLPSDIEFDVVIFDEASQVTPGDAINCIYRGKALIAAGDRRQLPPTSFFTAGATVDENDDKEDLANDYESILDLMKSSGGFNSLTLRWHYRSRHEHLIAYSNHSFYDGRLVTFPGAIDEDENLGVKFYLVDGVYRRSAGQDNPKEALAVAARVLSHFETRPGASLGVVAFSAAQRDSIENALTLARSTRPDLDRFFQDDRLDGLFIKSLEEVQGDERDVIILSIGYGPDESGKVYRNFGPINRKGGERRLNVAITRARQLVEVVSSMTAAQIGETTSEGSRHLRRYLDFAERGTKALALELGSEGLGTDSPFEDSVIAAIQSWGYEVQPQVGVAGFRIDIGVKHPNSPGVFMLGVECDGAMYHSSRAARDRDRLRHEVLEGLGWQIHHIWGTAWYRHRDSEMTRLRKLLEKRSSAPISGRLAAREHLSKPVAVKEEFEAEIHFKWQHPSWVKPYETVERGIYPIGVDLSETYNARHIVAFVQRVVEVEAPIHFEVLTARLREHSGIGRVGLPEFVKVNEASGSLGG